MITYQTEQWPELLKELKPILPLHYAEIGTDHDAIPLDPDWAEYMRMFCAGTLLVFTVRQDDELVGYHINIIRRGLHYKSNLFAMTDVFYLKKELRGSGAGFKLFLFVHDELKKLGVEKIFSSHKIHFDLSGLFEKLGYTPSDKMYTKLL